MATPVWNSGRMADGVRYPSLWGPRNKNKARTNEQKKRPVSSSFVWSIGKDTSSCLVMLLPRGNFWSSLKGRWWAVIRLLFLSRVCWLIGLGNERVQALYRFPPFTEASEVTSRHLPKREILTHMRSFPCSCWRAEAFKWMHSASGVARRTGNVG